MVESLYSLFNLSGSKILLSEYYQHFAAMRKVVTSLENDFSTLLLQNAMIEEFMMENSHEKTDMEVRDYADALYIGANEDPYAIVFLH